MEDPTRNKKLCAEMMQKPEKRCIDCEERNIKIYITHSQNNSRHYICWVIFKGVFRTQANIHDRVFFAKTASSFVLLVILVKALHCRCSTGF